MNNLTVSSSNHTNRSANFLTLNGSTLHSTSSSNTSSIMSSSNHSHQFLNNMNSHLDQYVFLFTSDFERIAWLNEINSAIYACMYPFINSR
jgi:hypothetical protein